MQYTFRENPPAMLDQVRIIAGENGLKIYYAAPTPRSLYTMMMLSFMHSPDKDSLRFIYCEADKYSSPFGKTISHCGLSWPAQTEANAYTEANTNKFATWY